MYDFVGNEDYVQRTKTFVAEAAKAIAFAYRNCTNHLFHLHLAVILD